MALFKKELRLARWFGDFGGDAFDNDFVTQPDKGPQIINALCAEDFEPCFREILSAILPAPLRINSVFLQRGTELLLAPAYGKYYSLAGQLALARMQKKTQIYTATYSREVAQAVATACQRFGFELTIFLGAKLSQDAQLVQTLKDQNHHVDHQMSSELLDLPYFYLEPGITDRSTSFVLQAGANYGNYPQPALVGVLAGLYGQDLKRALPTTPECLVVPISDGTEAIGAFKAFMEDECRLITVEEAVSQEYHIVDYFSYTLSTRSADAEKPNTTICPELAYWWRQGKVLRLGCDRIRPVNTSDLVDAGLSPLTARAAALALEQKEFHRMLVLEGMR